MKIQDFGRFSQTCSIYDKNSDFWMFNPIYTKFLPTYLRRGGADATHRLICKETMLMDQKIMKKVSCVKTSMTIKH